MLLFHGTDCLKYTRYLFMSTEKDFSEGYGALHFADFDLSKFNIFYSTQKDCLERLLKSAGEFYDPYNEDYYNSVDELLESPYFWSDSWEIMEHHLDEIASLGYDAVQIFEGGYENYIFIDLENTYFQQIKKIDKHLVLVN